jgi:hypothetical protein
MKKRKRKQKYDENYLNKLINRSTKNRELNNIDMIELLNILRGREDNKENTINKV